MKTVEEILVPLQQATSADGTVWSLRWMWCRDALMIWRADPGCPMEQHLVVEDPHIAGVVFEALVGDRQISG